MDNTPLHPDVVTLPQDSAGTRHGDFLAAVPYNRSMYRSTLCLRVSSVLLGITILGTLATPDRDDESSVMLWCLGSPTAALAILWSAADICALLVRDRGVRWTKDSGMRQRSTRFSWGHPGGHVVGHLIIWVATAALLGVVAKIFMEYNMTYPVVMNDRRAHVMTALLFFMFWLMVIHFALFVFACVEVDNIRRQYRDVVFVPRGELCEMVPVPPTTPMEIFVPRRMTLSFFANHYVRFVPGADGTVTVARDYSSRQARF